MSDEFARAHWYRREFLASNAAAYRAEIERDNKDINAFVSLEADFNALQSDAPSAPDNTSVLHGIPFAVKENIAHENRRLSCASNILKNFVSPFTASALNNLLAAGAVPVGRTNMDEFAMGSDTTHSIYGRTNNPWDTERSAGGSSGGSAAAVAAGLVPFALGSDTGGSIRQPASFCGIWGLKPTYGSVSRYGLTAFASSLDVIGILAEDVRWVEEAFAAMRVQGRDARDASSLYPEQSALPAKNIKTVGVYKAARGELDEAVQASLDAAAAHCKQLGYAVEDCALPMLEYSPAVYLNIAAAEASSNLARFDGIRYGNRGGFAENRLDLIRNARSGGFGEEVTLRVLTGGFALRSGFQDQCYIKAQKLRRGMRQTLAHLFTKFDVIVLPSFPTPAFRFDDSRMDPFHQKLGDAYSVLANLAGCPAISIPTPFTGNLPCGVQAMAPHYAEERLFAFARELTRGAAYRYAPRAEDFFARTGREGFDKKLGDKNFGAAR